MTDRVEPVPEASARAVVVNVHTDALAAVAVLSAVVSGLTTTLFNCEPSQRSRDNFAALSADHGFEVVDAGVEAHGVVLNRIFDDATEDVLLLLDSDAEIRDRTLTARLLACFDDDRVFGAGWTHGPHLLRPQEGSTARYDGYFVQRCWMPCTALRVGSVRRARAAGASFEASVCYTDFAFSPKLSTLAAKRWQDEVAPRAPMLRRLPASWRRRLAGLRFEVVRALRPQLGGIRPHLVVFDTGAEIFQWCGLQGGGIFAGTDFRLAADGVFHYEGGTWAERDLGQRPAGDTYLGVPIGSWHTIDPDEIAARLVEHYGVESGLVKRLAA